MSRNPLLALIVPLVIFFGVLFAVTISEVWPRYYAKSLRDGVEPLSSENFKRLFWKIMTGIMKAAKSEFKDFRENYSKAKIIWDYQQRR